MGECGSDNLVGICRRGTARRTRLGDNVPPPKVKGGVLGYWVGGSNMEGMCSGAEFKAEEVGGAS